MKFLYRPMKYDGFEVYHGYVYVFKDLNKIIFEFCKHNTYIVCGETRFDKSAFYYGNKKYKSYHFNKALRELQTIDSMNIFK